MQSFGLSCGWAVEGWVEKSICGSPLQALGSGLKPRFCIVTVSVHNRTLHHHACAQWDHCARSSRTVDCSPPIRSIHLSSKVPQPIRFSHLDPHEAEVLKIWLGKSRSVVDEHHTWRQDVRPAARKVNMMGTPWDGFCKMVLFVLALR